MGDGVAVRRDREDRFSSLHNHSESESLSLSPSQCVFFFFFFFSERKKEREREGDEYCVEEKVRVSV